MVCKVPCTLHTKSLSVKRQELCVVNLEINPSFSLVSFSVISVFDISFIIPLFIAIYSSKRAKIGITNLLKKLMTHFVADEPNKH